MTNYTDATMKDSSLKELNCIKRRRHTDRVNTDLLSVISGPGGFFKVHFNRSLTYVAKLTQQTRVQLGDLSK